jgi:hypothetical protein
MALETDDQSDESQARRDAVEAGQLALTRALAAMIGEKRADEGGTNSSKT